MFALALLSTSAHALSCADGIYSNLRDAIDLPTNVEIMLEHPYREIDDMEVVIIDHDGRELDIELGGGSAYTTVAPVVPLEIGLNYTLQVFNSSDELQHEQTFSVSTPADDQVPAPSELLSIDRERSLFGRTHGIRVVVEESDDDVSHYEYEFARDSDFSDAKSVVGDSETLIGRSVCLHTPGYEKSGKYFVRARPVDFAGNSPEWAEIDTLQPFGSVGCSSTTASGSLLLGGFATLLLLGRRRRA